MVVRWISGERFDAAAHEGPRFLLRAGGEVLQQGQQAVLGLVHHLSALDDEAAQGEVAAQYGRHQAGLVGGLEAALLQQTAQQPGQLFHCKAKRQV